MLDAVHARLQSLHGFEEKTGRFGSRERGTSHGVIKGRLSWLEQREQAFEPHTAARINPIV
jgi:hypothetical protein